MYQIIKDKQVMELQGSLSWVKNQSNGVVISCEEQDGQGILSADQSVIYSVVGKPQLMEYEFVEIEKIDWYPVAEQQRADIDYISIMTGVEL